MAKIEKSYAYRMMTSGYPHLIVGELCADIPLQTINGMPFDYGWNRIAKLLGEPSPFLDSGFVFNENIDLTFYPPEQANPLRLNIAVVHLLSRGICETGSGPESDQKYITARQYRDMFMQHEPDFGFRTLNPKEKALVKMRITARLKRK